MGTARNVCHRCRHKWKVSRGEWSQECPKCGHGNVGPTDPAPSLLPKLVVGGAILLGGAYYTGLIGGGRSPDELKAELQRQFEDAQSKIERDVLGPMASPAAPAATPAAPAPRAEQTPAERPAVKPRASETPAPSAASAAPLVVVKGRSGALLGGSYLVKGKLENSGGAKAEGVSVRVTFRDAQGAVLEVVEAECPASVEAGASARFEAALSGGKAERVESFEAEVSFQGS